MVFIYFQLFSIFREGIFTKQIFTETKPKEEEEEEEEERDKKKPDETYDGIVNCPK